MAHASQMETGISQLSMTVLMTPDMTNFRGNVHGGILLKLLDQVAYTCASRYAGAYAVTLSVDGVVFHEPIHVGELVTFDASINFTGRTSMEVGIRVTTEDFVKGARRHTNSSYFTMVTVDDDGRPIPVRPFLPETPTELRRHAAALRRREFRKQVDDAEVKHRGEPEIPHGIRQKP